MSTNSPTTHSFPPLESMQTDDYEAANAARQRLAPKSRLRVFSSLSDLRKRKRSHKSASEEPAKTNETPSAILRPSTGTEDILINLDGSAITDCNDSKDIYKWATLYENQRGLTIFSTPYYSSLSLLPKDPLPFTIPSTSSSRADQPEVSLTEYPLPDGNWRWVSSSWMIDMRTDFGEVQHDGFEYNWRFRPNKWSSNVGSLSMGGWVRRRRWVRLMMRPAKAVMGGSGMRHGSTSSSGYDSPRLGGSINSSVSPSEGQSIGPDMDASEVWKGDDVEQDWYRCHTLMKILGRDGRKLELWKRWLGGYYSEHTHLGHLLPKLNEEGKVVVKKQWTEDEGLMPSEAAATAKQPPRIVTEGASPELNHVAAVLHVHGDEILRSFIYPDSRAQFLALLGHTGLLPEMNIGLGIGWSTSDLDFWSYASGLDKKVEEDDAALERMSQEEEAREGMEAVAHFEAEVDEEDEKTVEDTAIDQRTPTQEHHL